MVAGIVTDFTTPHEDVQFSLTRLSNSPLYFKIMMSAIQQRVLVQDGGRVEVTSPELPVGAEADVIVLVRKGADTPSMTKLEALRALQASVNLSPEAAKRWTDEMRAEREAWGSRG
jgi:hypothetical protein